MGDNREDEFIRIALVLPTEYSYARGVLRGVIAATRERNQYVSTARPNLSARPWLFHVFRGIYGRSSRYLNRWLREWKPHGIICEVYDEALVRFYGTLGIPVVELFKSRKTTKFVRILPDDLEAGRLAARHFVERGFRHFGFFGSDRMLWSIERREGFVTELAKAFEELGDPKGYTFEQVSVDTITPPFSHSPAGKKGTASMAAWLASLPTPLAVFAANDLWGSELVQAAREVRRMVPDEVAILGVDNEELLCEIAHPPLSSIRLGSEQIGRAAVATMERLLAGEKLAGDLPRVPPLEVVTRQSTDVIAVEDPDVAAALRAIRNKTSGVISVKALLNQVPVNRRTLERRFVKVLGRTPLEEIQRVRLERVKGLLRSDLTIYQIARQMGYATPEYMATAFLKATGMTPTDYRKRYGPGTRVEQLPATTLE